QLLWLLILTILLRVRLCRDGLCDLANFQLRRLAKLPSLVTASSRNGDHQVVAVLRDLGAADAHPVDSGFDDLACLLERLVARRFSVGGLCGERDPGAALQVNAELGIGLSVPGEEHQAVQHRDDQPEDREIAPWAELPGRRCHSALVSCSRRMTWCLATRRRLASAQR